MLISVLRDIARLKRPVTASAFLAAAVTYLAPFGVELGPVETARALAILGAVGVISGLIERYAASQIDPHNPSAVSRAGVLTEHELLVAAGEPVEIPNASRTVRVTESSSAVPVAPEGSDLFAQTPPHGTA